jgi:hypothetical protein
VSREYSDKDARYTVGDDKHCLGVRMTERGPVPFNPWDPDTSSSK